MRNLILVLLSVVVLYSCNTFYEDDISLDTQDLVNQTDCDNLATFRYLGEDSKYVALGDAHNMILDDIVDDLVVSSCDSDNVQLMLNQLDDLVNENSTYMDVFSNFNSNDLFVMNDYITNHVQFCELESKLENKDKHKEFFDHLFTECENLQLFNEVELDLLADLSDKIILNGGEIFDLDPFFEQILSDQESYYNDGEFLLSILTIYDYSSCYWESKVLFDEENSLSNGTVETRFWFGRAVGDAAGAYTAGVANLIRTDGIYDGNDGLFDSMGRGAAAGSTFGASEILRAIWD